MRPVMRPVMRLTGRPQPTARTGELPRRSPISGGQAAESRRGAQGGGHSSLRRSAKSRRGGRGGATRRTTEFMAAIGGVWAWPAARRTRPRRRPLPAAAAPARPAPRGPPGRRDVARLAAAAGAASLPADPPAGRSHFAARSAADPPRGRGATPRSAAATRPGVVQTQHRRLARNLPGAGVWIACSRLWPAALRGNAGWRCAVGRGAVTQRGKTARIDEQQFRAAPDAPVLGAVARRAA